MVAVSAAHIARMSPKQKKIAIIAAAAVVAVIIVVMLIASCAPKGERSASGSGAVSSGYSSAGSTSCVPPMVCGPHYAGYVPPYFMAHPSFIYFTPYSSHYRPSYNGRSYTATRTPAGQGPGTSQTPMAYPPGYKPVPGDFQPPTASAKASAPVATQPSQAAAVPTSKSTVKATEPAKKAPAVKTPAPAKKAPATPKTAPKTKSGGR